MIDLELLVNISERNKMTKSLQTGPVLSGSLREGSSILDPVVLVEAGTLTGYNYAHIPIFGRYYYITDIVSVRTGLWEISMHTDPLMTYRSQLMDVSVILDTSTQTGADEYLTGPQWVARAKESTTVIPFPSGLAQDGEFILITAGG